ncbi:hypothetical protein GCM10014713_24920 [Streptomyces purpureus]|uniref:Uncharacterized protein n=1 Tax=Streptomyces purpureus TaxID=1951 RepID=A0A918LP38_9ACTN|nr:hypothetical protein GCM10014713_24920 [Streptomyces purpureus]
MIFAVSPGAACAGAAGRPTSIIPAAEAIARHEARRRFRRVVIGVLTEVPDRGLMGQEGRAGWGPRDMSPSADGPH